MLYNSKIIIMDRKLCVLLYSRYSSACIDLLKYIQALPFDFPSITGLSMMSVDNKRAREACEKNGIKGVPVLLIEYFFVETSNINKKQMLEKEQIYQWIDEVVKMVTYINQTTDLTKPVVASKPSPKVTFLNSNNKSDMLPMVNIPIFDEPKHETQDKSSLKEKTLSSKHASAAAIAAEIEQQRKLEDEKFTTSIKKNTFGNLNN